MTDPFKAWPMTNTHEREAERRLQQERQRADAEAAYRLANLNMPADIRERARQWGMETFCEVLWNNAWQAGFREGLRERAQDREDERIPPGAPVCS